MYIILNTFNMDVFWKSKIVLIETVNVCMYNVQCTMYICAYCRTCICMNNVYFINCSYVHMYINICLIQIRVVTDRCHLFGVWSASMLLKCINKQSNKLMCVCTATKNTKKRKRPLYFCRHECMSVVCTCVHTTSVVNIRSRGGRLTNTTFFIAQQNLQNKLNVQYHNS